MSENKHTLQELYQWQALPLQTKVLMTKERIRNWVHEYGEDGVYVSFSGGKDSTVLLHIAREMYGDEIKGVFVNTGLEYPEIVQFVKTFPNIDILKPKMNFKQVIERYGYPFISKQVCDSLKCAQKMVKEIGITNEAELFEAPIANLDERLSMLAGRYNEWYTNRNGKSATKGGGEIRSQKKYAFMIFSDYSFSSDCCAVMKKNPLHEYSKLNGRFPITGEQANESMLRTQTWLKFGCNGFNLKEPKSTPMAFWTEQDVLLYIKQHNIPICSVYGDVVVDSERENQVEGQMDFFDWDKTAEESELFDLDRPLLKTTGCDRTGCMFCGYGAHCKGDTRFVDMKNTHPTQYKWIMKPWSEGGLGYKEVIDWINEHGNLNIKY